MVNRICRGATLLEALLAILLLSLVVPGAWRVLSVQRNAGVLMAHRAEALETVRTLAWLLPEEVSSGRPGVDWVARGGDTLDLRAFRGQGLIDEGETEGATIRLCYWGTRSPIPDKDSVLLLGKDGRWSAHDLRNRTEISTGCLGAAGGTEERWSLSPDPPPSAWAKLYEKGSYHLSSGALRYRRGEGGRQPLTPERIESGKFMGPTEGGSPFAWELTIHSTTPTPDSVPSPRSALWRGRGR
jgi:hypothetical protein